MGFLRTCSIGLGVASAVLNCDTGRAADVTMPLKALPRVAAYDWTGAYFGGHVGYARGRVNNTLSDPTPDQSSSSFGALYGGLHAGYNHRFPSGWLIGVEADLSFPNYLSADDVVWSRTTAVRDTTEEIDYVGTVRARFGRTFGNTLVYGTGGWAFTHGRFIQTPGVNDETDKSVRYRFGWAAGAGTEVAIAPLWTARLEYLYTRFGETSVPFPSGAQYLSSFDLHQVRVGLSRKISTQAQDEQAEKAGTFGGPEWEVHGQATHIQQGYGRFNSPYVGQNSFTPWPQARSTTTATAYLGVRLWQGGEFYFAPELLQGFGLHDTTGAAGYPNGEAQKSNFPYPHYHTSRLFLRHTFGFGGEQETLESGPNQMASKVDVSRLTVQAGKFPVVDVFDGNSYARDPRKDFMNWSIWAAGAFDYAADKVGLGYGVVADFNQKDWALRSGYFLTASESNGNNFDMNVGKRGSYVIELETRHTLFGRPGKLRTIGWVNSTFSGSYRETLDNPALNLDIAQTRKGRIKYGYVFNVEQSITDDIGMFGRWSWNDGKNEIMAFTDIDASLSGGVSIKGTKWGREEDKIGIGYAINALSNDHRDFIAAGGLGVLIGDGRLNYRKEQVFETYYSIAMHKELSLTLDYQLLTNPAYNADRGPISVYAARLHWER
jgi:high affinity Mn2+ porin